MTHQDKHDLWFSNLILIMIWRFGEITFYEYLGGTGSGLLFCVKSHKSHSNRDRLSFFSSMNVYLMYLGFQIQQSSLENCLLLLNVKTYSQRREEIYWSNKGVTCRGWMNLAVITSQVNTPFSVPCCFQSIPPKNKADYELVNCIWVGLPSNQSCIYGEEYQCWAFKVVQKGTHTQNKNLRGAMTDTQKSSSIGNIFPSEA